MLPMDAATAVHTRRDVTIEGLCCSVAQVQRMWASVAGGKPPGSSSFEAFSMISITGAWCGLWFSAARRWMATVRVCSSSAMAAGSRRTKFSWLTRCRMLSTRWDSTREPFRAHSTR